MSNINLTILMATYNGEKYLEEQLESLLNQSYKAYKIICNDDCSTDSTFKILKEYEAKYSTIIKVTQNKKQLGVVSNFEKLISETKTEYIALCDQDDIWEKEKLMISIKALEDERNLDIPLLFHCDLTLVNSNLEKVHSSFFKTRCYSFPKKRSIDILLGRSGVMGNTMVFNQKLKEKILPFPKFLVVHDYWIALMNEATGKRITYSKSLIKYRIHHNNTSAILRKSFKNKILERKITLPYQNIKREEVLKIFLTRVLLTSKEIETVRDFIQYLEFKKSKLYIIYLVITYKFFRYGFKYKLKLIGAIVWKKR